MQSSHPGRHQPTLQVRKQELRSVRTSPRPPTTESLQRRPLTHRAQGQPSGLLLPVVTYPTLLSSSGDVAVCTQQAHNLRQMLSPPTAGPPSASAVGQEGSQSTARSNSGGKGDSSLQKGKSSMRWGRVGGRAAPAQVDPGVQLIHSHSPVPPPLPPLHGLTKPFHQGPSPPRTWFPHPSGEQTQDPTDQGH